MNNKNIIAVRNLIRALDCENLKNPEVVANLIRAFGIVAWGPPAFGDEEIFKNHNENMAGIYQTPPQLAGALVYLSEFEINSYLEIGVFQGGNFIFVSEYLRRFNPGIKCFGIDPTFFLNPEIAAIINQEDWLSFEHATSVEKAKQKYDLVFIDGEHHYGWPVTDWHNVGIYAKVCVFHDAQDVTCPEVVDLWESVKSEPGRTTAEFFDHSTPEPTQGIGIVS